MGLSISARDVELCRRTDVEADVDIRKKNVQFENYQRIAAMSKKKSNVWQYFYKTSGTVATCLLCNRNYSRRGRGTTCLRNHLKSKHPPEFLSLSGDIKYLDLVKSEISIGSPQHPTAQLELNLHVSGIAYRCAYIPMYMHMYCARSVPYVKSGYMPF